MRLRHKLRLAFTTLLWTGLAAAANTAIAQPAPASTESEGKVSTRKPVSAVLPPGFVTATLDVEGPRAGKIRGYVLRPPTIGPEVKVPAIIALHGCGGPLNRKGRLSARHRAWAKLLTSWGYAVIFPDSFNPRGFREICRVRARERPIKAGQRFHDAAAAMKWLKAQAGIDANRIAILGWSNGGSATLHAASSRTSLPAPDARVAIAFYPGCRVPARNPDWRSRIPLTILIGASDNWTRPEHCRRLARHDPGIRLIEYPGAVHGFDAPNSPRRTRHDAAVASDPESGVEVGTDPKARAAAIAEVKSILQQAFSNKR
ncbi:MAG: dienelactone hydrolase family protein [Hyphomicrobiaceae bacterium]